ncbi:MAG TPA: hypothetical protein VGN56_02530 [Candidatus Paceibacterota bacterium]|jgi:UDPglucose 6-dehydrogenase|nr:hypothetical protein [Candidatus Paceibacterota bacterium]
MKIGVIGVGVVGSAVQHGLERIGHTVRPHDTKLDTDLADLSDTEVCFLCVPTPPDSAGRCDTSIIESVLVDLSRLGYRGVIAIKSTVIPGTTDSLATQYPALRLAFCPEFLRERAAFVDFFENHDLCAIGAYADADFELIRDAHGSIPKRVSRLTPLEAELVKYFSNVFNAMRITFANEFYDVCEALGANYTNVKNAAVQRENIPDYYLDCNENFRGFAGVCLPKDTSAFAALVKELGLSNANLFATIVQDNENFIKTVPDGMRR